MIVTDYYIFMSYKKKIAFYFKVLYVFLYLVALNKLPEKIKVIKKITDIGYNKMKQPSNKNRTSGRYPHFNNRRNNPNTPTKNTVFDSSGPCGRMRGTAIQLSEKYQTAAKDSRHNDSVLSEICLQYADHYHRIYAAACMNDKPPVISNVPDNSENTEIFSSQEPIKTENSEECSLSTEDTLPSYLPFMATPLPSEKEEKNTSHPRKIRKTKTSSQKSSE